MGKLTSNMVMVIDEGKVHTSKCATRRALRGSMLRPERKVPSCQMLYIARLWWGGLRAAPHLVPVYLHLARRQRRSL